MEDEEVVLPKLGANERAEKLQHELDPPSRLHNEKLLQVFLISMRKHELESMN